MIYLSIGIAIVIIGGIFYLIYRKRVTQPSRVPEEKASETTPESTTTPEPPETASEAVKVAYPAVSEISSLTESDKNKLINAVWYRCENPYCNYTQFLDVHHIISEVEGGTNKLDNLIVLCPVCHAAADNHEVSEKQLQSWVRERTERFKSELDWPYK